jgi:thiol-disulfide isomerase/thioredoxin
MRPTEFFALLLCFWISSSCLGEEVPAGVGLSLEQKGERISVLKVLPGTPADRSGQIHEHDVVVAIGEGDADPVKATEIGAALRLLKGKKGTVVKLTIIPVGKTEADVQVISIVREQFNQLDWGDGKLLSKGVEAPDVQFSGLSDDHLERLSSYRGKIVILSFWATWCGSCEPEMASFQRLIEKHPQWKEKVLVFAASTDEHKEDAARRVNEKGWDKTKNIWVDKSVRWEYHIDAIPICYIIDAESKISAVGDAGNVDAEVDKLLGIERKAGKD